MGKSEEIEKRMAIKERYKERNIPSRCGVERFLSIFIEFERSAGFLFIREKKERISVRVVSIHDPGLHRYAIKTSNDAGRKQYTLPFLHQRRISLSFCVGAPSVSHSFPLSHPCATASQRGVCSGSLTCCMLFCPGPSAILVF